MTDEHIQTERHPIGDPDYIERCRSELTDNGALVLPQFVRADTIEAIVAESTPAETAAFYANSTHNVYLTPSDPALPEGDVFNRQIVSTKGLIADDQIGAASPLRTIYDSPGFRSFLCGVLGIEAIYPYDDELSSINVHFAAEGMELGWHFDNSSFAVTMLLQAPDGGGHFEYVPDVRSAATGDLGKARVSSILDGAESVQRLHFRPGDLVLFRGRDALHRVTPTEGATTRMLVVFAYNDEPGISLSESARMTFYGRNG